MRSVTALHPQFGAASLATYRLLQVCSRLRRCQWGGAMTLACVDGRHQTSDFCLAALFLSLLAKDVAVLPTEAHVLTCLIHLAAFSHFPDLVA